MSQSDTHLRFEYLAFSLINYFEDGNENLFIYFRGVGPYGSRMDIWKELHSIPVEGFCENFAECNSE